MVKTLHYKRARHEIPYRKEKADEKIFAKKG
jgi:hypothetical protein